MLAHAEQIRAQQLTDEQVEQLVRQTRSSTKTARTQAAPSACAQAQAEAAAAAAAMRRARRAPASVIAATRSRLGGGGGPGQKRCRAGEQRASGYNISFPYYDVLFHLELIGVENG